MSADNPARSTRRVWMGARLFAFGRTRGRLHLLRELLPALLAKTVAAALLWWMMSGAHH